MKVTRSASPWLAVALCAASAGAAAPEPVAARLVTDRARPGPDGVISVGVLFTIASGWHIYWKNPGDTGLATRVELTPPEGFVAGALRWPLPEHIVQAGELTSYGYQGSTLLATELRLSERMPAHPDPIRAVVSWLACKESCVLGETRLELELPAPRGAVESGRFARWREDLPRPLGAPGAPFELTVIGGVPRASRQGELSVWLRWRQPPRSVELFPEAGERLRAKVSRVVTRGDLTRVDMSLRVLGSDEDRARVLPALVVVIRDSGDRRGYQVSLPVETSS